MPGKHRKPSRVKDFTDRYLQGDMDEGGDGVRERFSERGGDSAQLRKMERTALLRAAEESAADVELLPLGEVIQVHSLFQEVAAADGVHVTVLRKTLMKLRESAVVVGDRVRFRDIGSKDERGRPEAVIEQVQPRQTVLTRSDSFKGVEQHPIVANAQQMLIVVSLREPTPRWGLVDRMIVAAQAGGLRPIVCVNKFDLIEPHTDEEDIRQARAAMDHYLSLGHAVLATSVLAKLGLDELKALLKGCATVLAGHSGVGKSSLIRAIEPLLDLRIAEISGYTGKGRHTTTSARRYVLEQVGEPQGNPTYVIDTPGVKLFGLWNVTAESLLAHFPDVEAETAPAWRVESYERILRSIGER